ncbi:MAG TPA: S1/P1 nuclease, partial [Puia sp.]
MKKVLHYCCGMALICLCISWGATGHRTVADIAFNHLTPKAKAAVAGLLGTQTMADVSTWADEIRNQPRYRATAPDHFINMPLGLSHEVFEQEVAAQPHNAYVALLHNEDVLRDAKTTKEQKTEALKLLIHFVGDIHQPMHVSRAEDKGGNTIQVRYLGRGTNLHALWDSKLLDHAGLDDGQLSQEYDHVTEREIQKWQKTPAIEWAWESYQISTQLYAAAQAPRGNIIDDAYYARYMPVIQQRLEQAGVRLAGLLNEIFKDGLPASVAGPAALTPSTTMEPAGDNFCAVVYGGKYFDNSGMTLLNLGAPYPNNTMTVVIYKKDRGHWSDDPIKKYNGKKICVTGKRIEYQGRPEI